MRKLALTAALAAGAIVLAGCSGTPAEPESGEIRVWLVGADTPEDARNYLIETFEDENPGSTLVIEEQQWTGLVDTLTTALSSNDSPDIVEVGNTQAPAFTSVGAFRDLSGVYEELGGDDLLPGFVEAATLDDYVANAGTIAAALPGVSGVYWPGQDWYNALPFIWENGGEVAVLDGDQWDAQFSSPESLAGLEQVAEVMASSTAPKDGDETDVWVPFREEQGATLSAPSWAYWSIVADADQAPTALTDTLGYFALPGKDGGAAQVFAGGSNIAISAKSANPTLAESALKIIFSDEYQAILAANGLVPAKQSLGDQVAAASPELAAVIAEAAANAKLTPASPKWADVEAARLLQDFFVKIATGGDIEALATQLDLDIEEILNG
jgi:N,N'-diacetylchitobiose transport system substrate-binding protein